MRAAGVPGRGENGNTCRCVSPHSSTRSSERANIVLGLGREAGDDVGAEHDVRAAAAAPDRRTRWRRRARCRRFMRLRIRSSPACSDRCRCGISRGSSAKRVEQVAVGLDRIDRGQPQPLELRHVLEDLLHQRAELRRARQVRAVAREIDAGEHDLAIAALDQPAHLRHDLAHRHRARIAAAIRDDAEGAAVVAAVLHLHEGARAAFEAVDQVQRRSPSPP